jgi:ATP-dependent helicase/nuclease subunit A
MKEQNLPSSWHAAILATQAALPWRQAADGRLVLGADFTTAPVAVTPTTVVPPNPDFSALATPLATPAVPNPAQSAQQQWGEWVHAALQGLPVAAPALMQAQAQALAARVREAFPWMFTQSSQAEVAVVLPQGGVGRIDRLVEHNGTLWVLDFKTGQVADPIPATYISQLHGYAAALQAEPGEPALPLRLGLVWVEAERGPTLVEIAVSG